MIDDSQRRRQRRLASDLLQLSLQVVRYFASDQTEEAIFLCVTAVVTRALFDDATTQCNERSNRRNSEPRTLSVTPSVSSARPSAPS